MTKIAETLCDLGRHEEALSHAQQAIRLGRACDQFDWATGLRVAAVCQAALGRIEAARTTIAEADAILRSSECQLERRNLAATARKPGNHPRFSGDRRDGVGRGACLRSGTDVAASERREELPVGRSALRLAATPLRRERSAGTDRGRTGTGKELVAHLLHELGPWSKGPLVVVDCTTLSESLAEVELFGAARGAYTRR